MPRKPICIDLTVDDGIEELTRSDYERSVQMEGLPRSSNRPSGPGKGVSSYNPPSQVNIQPAGSRSQNQLGKRLAPPTTQPHVNKKRRKVEGKSPSPLEFTSPRSEVDVIEFVSTVSSSSRHKRNSRVTRIIDVIELSSDDEGDFPVEVQQMPPTKKRKTHPPELKPVVVTEKDSDNEDYENIHAGYSLHDPATWKPVQTNENRVQRENILSTEPISSVEDELANLNLSDRPKKYRPVDVSIPFRSRSYASHPIVAPWDSLRIADNYRPRRRIRHTELPGMRTARSRLDLALDFHQLKRTACFKECPGSIVRIDQKDGWIAIGGASIGGDLDVFDELPNPYNRPGSLMTWYDGREHILKGHQAMKDGSETKHYALDDVKFDPCSSSFVTSGKDQTVRVWHRLSHAKDYCGGYRLGQFADLPVGLAFNHGTSVLAVGERKVHIFKDISQKPEKLVLELFPKESNSKVGFIQWGCGPTSGYLYASSETATGDDETTPAPSRGYHRAFDVAAGVPLHCFDAQEDGDAMCLDSTGSMLMISTMSPENNGIIRLYDVGRKLQKAITKTSLEAFPSSMDGEVTGACFSTDNIYLALSRIDNCTHVYDSRMLGKGVLFKYRHFGECKVPPSGQFYGVTKAQWVESTTHRSGLVTAGEDGCVRLWDPLQASENKGNGIILAEVNYDIGWFSLGDRFKGEHQLVVGDCAGEVSIFDRFRENLQSHI